MSKKYFIVSDVHSFFDEMKEALDQAGYDKTNKSHVIIFNGDIFDRGPKSLEMYKFIKSIHKSRRILIKGNHELLLLDALKSELPGIHDISNGTVKTLCQLAKVDASEFTPLYLSFYNYYDTDLYESLVKYLKVLWKRVINHSTVKKVKEWFESDEWLNFYELDNFIFTHAFIPLRYKNGLHMSEYRDRPFDEIAEYFPTWRTESTESELFNAKWKCPWKLYQAGHFLEEEMKGKTLVVGHWHTDDFHRELGAYTGEEIRHDMYLSNGIIALDGGVMRDKSKNLIYDCNVLIVEDNKLYDKTQKELTLEN